MDLSSSDCAFDVARVPFSTFGSWMSLSVAGEEKELFFRNHHNGANDLFPLRPLVDGTVVECTVAARPWKLVLDHQRGRIEVCFESPNTIRMRGQGLGLQLGGRNLVYREGPGFVTLNKPQSRRYGLELLHGSVELTRQVPTQPVFPVTVDLWPAEEGQWEVAVDEYWSTWERPARQPFDQCVNAARRAFLNFVETMPTVRPEDESARALAAYVIWSCTMSPCGLLKRPTVFMSKNWMCNVWSWDQCFNALALAEGQPDLALDQMLTLVDHQDKFGSYPDSVNDLKIHYNFSKPPVHGMTFREMLNRMPRQPAAEVLETMYASLARQADWWMNHRRLEGNRLPHYLHGNDSGWDNSTMFAQGVPLVAPDLAALLVLQMEALGQLARDLSKDNEATQWVNRAAALQADLLSELWQGDQFIARLANEGTPVTCHSLIPWLPIILGQRLPETLRGKLKQGLESHLTDWGLATEKVDSPHYRENGYWQGPVWAPSTYLAVAGLDAAGFGNLADAVADRFCKLCRHSGFAENFDALTGAPLCDPAYTWTASVFLLLAHRMSKA